MYIAELASYRVYLGESFPLRVRSKCIALGSATSTFIWLPSGPNGN